ncbi:hypothetical protein [Bacteriovorax sp. DB6_IX]|uniref:hypothetical protein n=1 Tax=Bacteriovorax sp. DB6_IX TaxID=1353530 RepID=UPI000389E1AB|nr:hypothetical protein [Bacteriovorax sp. DB6_IX]EQC52143.1 putative lipoprotein [Bacteriovorax sp. DB6_IX]
MRFLPLLFIIVLSSCGTAKTQYIETKYDLCMKKCSLQYSKYEATKMATCKASCIKDKYVQ